MADADLLAHIRRIWQRTSNHNRDVKLLFEQVGHSLRQEKIDRYVGIGTPIRERGTRNEAASYTGTVWTRSLPRGSSWASRASASACSMSARIAILRS